MSGANMVQLENKNVSRMNNNIISPIIIGTNSANPLTVNRPGYGTMRLTGEGIWGEPKNRDEALRILKRAVELGVNYIDTADYYGLGVTNRLITEALFPYPGNLVIGTKIGAKRGNDKSWNPFSKPEQLRESVENNLKELQLEQLALVHYRVMHDDEDSFKRSMEMMFAMKQEGKILHVGISNVSAAQFEAALKIGDIATVQNLYGYTQRTTPEDRSYGVSHGGAEVLSLCEQHQIPLIPYFSLHTSLNKAQEKIKTMAEKYTISIAQMNIVWLLHKSEWILPIPGTTSVAHLEENLQAEKISISKEDMDFLG